MYSMYIGMISRSKGSTVDSLAYRAGVKLECSLTGERFNRDSKDVEDVILSLPKDAPQWALDLQSLIKEDRTKGIQEFCNIVEGAEHRKDAQVFREFRISLPRDFTKEQSKALVNEFLEDQVCAHGITALQNYHFDVNKRGEENPHCHVVLLTRRLTANGLGLKERSWNTKQYHEQWRSQWASYGNYHLLKNGYEANWDHRSYKERGIVFEPQPKLGSKIIKMEMQADQNPKDIYSKPVTEKGREYQEVKLSNLYKLIDRPEHVLEAISKQQTTFMWGDVAKLLGRYVDDQALFDRLSLKIQQSSELVCLEEKGGIYKNVLTTRTRLAEEKQFIETINGLKENESHCVESFVVEKALKKATMSLRESLGKPEIALSQDQIEAIKHMSLGSQLSFVEGYAGAGKTTVMKVMTEIWEESGYRVYGLAPTGRAAENLSECGISSTTIHSFLKSFEGGRSQYDQKSVFVLDEAGMVDSRCFNNLIQAVDKLGVKLVASGDRGQLSPVEAGVPFRLAVEEAGKAGLTTVLRQEVDWQVEVTGLFGQGKADEALKLYGRRGHIRFCDEFTPQDVVERYNLSRRMAGNLGYEIHKDVKEAQARGKSLTFASHQDYRAFLGWKKTRDESVKTLHGDIDTYRDRMRNLGVDGVDFAKKVIAHKGVSTSSTNAYDLAKELQINWRDKAFHVCNPRLETKKKLLSDWFQSTKDNVADSHTMMAFSNKDVQSLNTLARGLKRAAGDLGKEEYIYTIERNAGDDLGTQKFIKEERHFSVGDQIVFTKIDRGLGVKNGTLGRVTELSKSNIKVVLDKEGDEISFSPNLYNRFDNGWAVTLHKNQGVTIDRAYVLASFEQYKNLAYVALTRHVKDVQVYASRFEFWRDEKLFDRLGRSQDKLSSLDYVSGERVTELLKSDERLLSSSLKRVGQRLEAVGYVGQRAWSGVCDKFLGRTAESNLIRIDQEALEGLTSEADRADEKFKSSIDVTGFEKKSVEGQALSLEPDQPEKEKSIKKDEVFSIEPEAVKLDQQKREDQRLQEAKLPDVSRDVFTEDFDGCYEKPSLQEKVNILPSVKNIKLTQEKVDFNSLLKEGGSELARVSEQISHREIKDETKDIPSNKATTDFTKFDQSTKTDQEPLEKVEAQALEGAKLKNIVAYFDQELALEKNKYFNKENVFKQVKADPLDYLKWWQDKREGAPFDPSKPLEEQKTVSQDISKNDSNGGNQQNLKGLTATDDFVKNIQSLEEVIDVLSETGRSPEKLEKYSKELETKLLDINEKNGVMDDLKERHPVIAERAVQTKQDHQQSQEHEKSKSFGIEM